MNNFTKEELEIILRLYDAAFGSYIEGLGGFMNKIQSMIDNYCEHESDGDLYLSLPPKNKCIKCGGYYK